MLTEAVRVVADWLAHATHGVNAQLSTVPKDGGMSSAAMVTIYDETRHPEVARGQVPDTLPALLVSTSATPLNTVSNAVRPFPADAEIELGIRYAVSRAATDQSTTDLAQIDRAVRRSLGALWTTAAGESARARNSVHLISWRSYRLELYQANDDTHVTAAMVVTITARDVWAAS